MEQHFANLALLCVFAVKKNHRKGRKVHFHTLHSTPSSQHRNNGCQSKEYKHAAPNKHRKYKTDDITPESNAGFLNCRIVPPGIQVAFAQDRK